MHISGNSPQSLQKILTSGTRTKWHTHQKEQRFLQSWLHVAVYLAVAILSASYCLMAHAPYTPAQA